MSKEEKGEEKTFPQIGEEVEGGHMGPTRIESLCINCEENGETRILFVTIPHFREVIVSSFFCDHCGSKNEEIQFGGSFSENGIVYELSVKNTDDLNRQIVKSDYCGLKIPEVEFEIEANQKKGELTTVEGVLLKAIENLQRLQPVRKIQQPEVYEKIEVFIGKMEKLKRLESPFTIIMDDPSGNSNVENLFLPKKDPQIQITHYERSLEQNKKLGLMMTHEDDVVAKKEIGEKKKEKKVEKVHRFGEKKKEKKVEKVHRFMPEKEAKMMMDKFVTSQKQVEIIPDFCFNCGKLGECRSVLTKIPHFKEILILAFTCEHCGFRSNEVKGGGSISPKGRKISLKCTMEEDLARDVLKSETAAIFIPELEVEITHGSLGGRFTTVEGVIVALIEQFERTFQFGLGDSEVDVLQKGKLEKFLKKLDNLRSGKIEFTFIIDDPIANSFVQNIYAPDDDPNMTIEDYVRTREQDDDLGLLDMKTENYEEVEKKE